MTSLRLQKIHLVNFKNYADATMDLQGNIHCFFGKNGSGKTNLLEAIHYLAFTKGGGLSSDAENVRHGADHFHIKGNFLLNGKPEELMCSFSIGEKKIFYENGKAYSRFSDHIGKYPLVAVEPADIELVWDGGEIRRRFFDALISQLDKAYLQNLIIYQAQLRQRNSLLKIFAERGSVDRDLLETYNEKLVSSGTILFQKRAEFVSRFIPWVRHRYEFLADGGGENACITYQSDLSTIDFQKEMQEKVERDLAIGRTMTGVHRDDFLFTLKNLELKKFGSQGQQKSFLIALKLAEFDSLSNGKGTKPLVLLDDIFDKLDDDRIRRLMQLTADGTLGQVFITDARPSRSMEALREAGVKSQNFRVGDGKLSPE